MKADKRAFFTACSKASKAADYLRGLALAEPSRGQRDSPGVLAWGRTVRKRSIIRTIVTAKGTAKQWQVHSEAGHTNHRKSNSHADAPRQCKLRIAPEYLTEAEIERLIKAAEKQTARRTGTLP